MGLNRMKCRFLCVSFMGKIDMTQDEIIEIARQTGDTTKDARGRESFDFDSYGLEAFAKLVAAKERKEICGIVQQIVPITSWAHELLDAIRARGEA